MLRFIPFIIIIIFLLPGRFYAQADSTYEMDDISFSGNESFSSGQLAGQLTSQETPGWFWKFLYNVSWQKIGKEPTYFDSLNIQEDIQSLKAFYNRNGYLETVISAEFEIDSADKSASLTFNITEGPPFYIDNFRLRGVSRLSKELTEELSSEIRLDSGSIYTQAKVEESQSRISTFLLNNGYMLASIERPTLISIDTINYEENFVDITIRINLGRRYQLGDITVNKGGPGADLIDSSMIKDIAGLSPGEYYNFGKIRRAQSRLSRTNLFTSIFVEPIATDTANTIVPMEIKGDVGLLNEAAPEFLVNNEENGFNVGIGLSYTRKNFFGQARKFTIGSSVVARDILNIDYGNFFNSLSLRDTTLLGLADLRVSIEQPYLFSRSIYGTWDTYIKLNKQNEYNATIYGTKFSADIETPLYTYFNSLVAYVSYESAIYLYGESYIYNNVASILTKAGQSVEGLREYFRNTENRKKTDNTSYLGIEAAANKSDDLLFPTVGYNLYLSIEEGNSLSYLYNKLASNDLNFPLFYKAMVNSSFYFDLYSSSLSTFAVKLKSGYIQAYRGTSSNIPLNRRLYAGGSNSVRGWASRELVPLTNQPFLSIDDLGNQDLLELFNNTAVIGGTFLFEGSLETRNRLFGAFGGALFLDFGNSWNGYKSARIDEIAVASGFGFRYYSPFGPIRVDLGFKTYDPSDKKWIFRKPFFHQLQFHVAIGEAF